ncbi:hypothetical protein GCM10011414_00120 [Croceivirga lutea]|uniref:hypothetical protein n=1 Tax=Croceivirga lutea TaxID=1775167 RepID=UPI001639B080|nr:hypothetical protein [Croceivirga lutea]GGG34643.1 hypothetical protein GCM10011414_00120 [Croceivirga lutea]
MRVFKFLSFLTVAVLVVACNFTEEIFLDDNGSGKINIHFNGDELMAAMGSMGTDSTSLEEKIDTTLVFRDLLEERKDSIAQLPVEEQEKLKKLEPFTMHMVMDSETQKMSFDMYSEFKNVNEVNDAFNAFQDASSIGPSSNNDAAGQKPPQMPTEVVYDFNGNTFSRTVKILDETLFEKSLDSLQSAEMFLSSSTYTFKYHFPRRIKATSAEGATFSMDGKTMIYEVNFLNMMKNPTAIDFTVELEKK